MEKLVIIPAFNPDDKLKDVVLRNLELDNQILLVDDGSEEKYRQFFWELSENCTVLHHRENKGKGEAIKTALKYLKDQQGKRCVIGIMDADGQHLPDDLEKLFRKAGSHPHTLVLGSRQMDEVSVPWKSRMGSRITRKVFKWTTGVSVYDTQTGLRAFSSDLLEFMLEVPGSRYEYEINVLVQCARQQIEITEVPIETIYHDQNNSCSHFRKVRDSFRIYKNLLKFSLFSFSSFLLDYGLFLFFTGFLPSAAWGVMTANVGARILSAGYNYLMNCHFVFQEDRTFKTAGEYLVLAALILSMNNLVLQFFMWIMRIPVYEAKVLTEITLFLFSWLVQRTIIFPDKTENILHKRKKSGEPV